MPSKPWFNWDTSARRPRPPSNASSRRPASPIFRRKSWFAAACVTFSALLAACAGTDDADAIEDHLHFAGEFYDRGKFVDAAGQFNKVLEKDPDHFDAWIGLGNCEREIGSELYSNATVTVQTRGARPEELKLAQTEVDRAHKHHTQSRACFERALELKPRNNQALYGLGQLYLTRASGGFRLFTEDEQGDMERHFVAAEKCFALVVGTEPASYPAHYRLGLARLGMGDRAQAKPSLELYLKRLRQMETETGALKPENDEDRAVLQQQLMIVRKDIADTESLIEQCDTPVPASSLEPIHTLAKTLRERSRHAEAIAPLERCLTRARSLKAGWTAWTPADEKGRKLRTEELEALEERIETLQGELDSSRAAVP